MAERKREQKLNDRVLDALVGFDPRRCENAVDVGTPDIHYIGGWLEDKQVKEWPKRPTTVLALEHYVQAQRAWHVRRRAAGGRVHVVLEVGRDVMVFDALDAAQHLGLDWTRKDCIKNAVLVMSPWHKQTFHRFITELTGG